ncbi:MAG TPA: MFS transporter [Phycisphaerales bacterium]|nr:MFS transporter [Phycisphaerales bacterium]
MGREPSTFRALGLPVRAARRATDSFRPDAMPASVRRNYSRELPGTALFAVGRAAFDGAILGIVVRIAFDGVVRADLLNYAVALIAAAPAFANIINFIWARAVQGRHKIRFIVGVQSVLLGLVLLLAFVPRSPVGLAMLCAIVIGIWVCWSGFVAIRTTIWRANYPRAIRARIAGKFSTVQTLILSTFGLTLGTLMGDRLGLIDPRLSLERLGLDPIGVFRAYVVVCVVCGAAGVAVLSTLRVRRHKRMLRDERESTAERTGPTLNPLGVVRLLLEDRRFGAYQVNQFLMGIGNLMVMPLIPIILRDRFGVGYFEGILLASTLPMAMIPFMIPAWARLLDRVHVVRFRSVHSWVFVALIVLLFLATELHIKWLLYVAAVLKGIGMSGGMLAWQLGHHDFAPRQRASEYMGVHVTLTGVRGLIGPAAAVALYNRLDALDDSFGPYVLLLCLALVLAGAIGFVMMTRRLDLTPADAKIPADSTTRGPAVVSKGEL